MTEHKIDLNQLAQVRDGSGHSVFGASGNAHFLLCLGALIPNLLVKDAGNIDAAYGTVAHAVTEQWLNTGVRPDHLIGTTKTKDGFEIKIDEEMLEYASECVDRCEWESGAQLVEEHVDYSCLTPIPNQGGTLDFAAMRYQEAVVTDHKFGKAEQIFAERNYQLMLYSYGLFLRYDWLYDFQRFIIRVNQPRLDHYDEWVCSRAELLEFAEWAKVRMHGAWAIDATRTPGDKQCRYCKIRTSCVANAKHQAELCEGIFTDTTLTPAEMRQFKDRLEDEVEDFELNIVDAGQLTTANIVALLKQRRTAEKFWSGLDGELFRRSQAGEKLVDYGFKIVEGRSNRLFRNDGAARERLVALGCDPDDLVKSSTVSPAEAEKLLLKAGHRRKDLPELLKDLVFKRPGKATLAPLSDKRDAIGDLDGFAFEDVTTSETEEL